MTESDPGHRTVGRLRLRRVGIDTYRENVAFLHRDCATYRAEGFQALSKVEITTDGRRILAVLNVVDDPSLVGTEELGLSEQAYAQLGVPEGRLVRVEHAEPPGSMDAVRRKIVGERLTLAEYRQIAGERVRVKVHGHVPSAAVDRRKQRPCRRTGRGLVTAVRARIGTAFTTSGE